LVPLSGMADDFYQYDSGRGQLVGCRTRRVIKLGDRVQVQVAKVDRFKKQVDFRLAARDGTARQHGRGRRRSG
jgi:ribonuclease R